MGKVIILSGIDGSGKSTHARKLASELQSSGNPVKYLWMRGQGRIFLSFMLLTLCRLLGITKVRRLENGVKVSEYPFYAYRPLRLLFPWLQFFDSLLYSGILVHRPLLRSHDIIMDRSAVDTFVDIIAYTHAPVAAQLLQRLLLALLPKGSLVVVLDLNEETAMRRKRDVLCIDYLKSRRRIYRHLAENYGWYILSTEFEFKKVHELIMRLIEKEY